jgi:hypothetical protein
MTKCRDCCNPMTWSAQRRQFARLVHRGVTLDEAKQLMPRCQKCVTQLLRWRPQQGFGLLRGGGDFAYYSHALIG